MKKVFLWLGTFVILAAGTFAGCKYFMQKERSTVTPQIQNRVVKLYKITSDSPMFGITYPGKVKAVRRAELFFRVSGPVIERNLKYGQTVEEGEVLMRIDPRDYEREVARLTEEVRMQKVQCELSEIEYTRNLKLRKSNAVSQATMDTATTKKRTNDAKLSALEVSLKIAKDRLNDTVLKAPFHGTISSLLIEKHEIAKANVPVVVVDDLRQVEIRINIPAGNMPNMSAYDAKKYRAKKFEVSFPGRGNRKFEASIYEFKPVASDTSESFELALRMELPKDFLVLPGMSAEVHNIPAFQHNENSFLLPFAAVFIRQDEHYVWKYEPETKKIVMHEIKLGAPYGKDYVRFTDGLKPGDYVVAAGGDWLSGKETIQVLNPEILK